MHRCSVRSAGPRSLSELPILPFLAPAVFYSRPDSTQAVKHSTPAAPPIRAHHTGSRRVSTQNFHAQASGKQGSRQSFQAPQRLLSQRCRHFSARCSQQMSIDAAPLSPFGNIGHGDDATAGISQRRAASKHATSFTPNIHDPSVYDKTLFEPTDDELAELELKQRQELVESISRRVRENERKPGHLQLARLLAQVQSSDPQFTFWMVKRYLSDCNVAEAALFYDWMKLRGVTMHFPMMREFVKLFSENAGIQEGLRVLKDMQNSQDKFAPELAKVHEQFVFAATAPAEGRDQIAVHILSSLSDMHYPLGASMSNLVLLRAFKTNDFNTALAIFDARERLSINLDDTSYGILLRMCREHKDQRSFAKVVSALKGKESDQDDNVPFGNLVAYVSFDQRVGYARLFKIYEKYYDITPQRELGMINPKHISKDLDHSTNPVSNPQSPTTAAMMLAYLRQYPFLDGIERCYANFQKLIRAGHPSLVPLAENIDMYNVFLKNFGRVKGMARNWSGVMQDLQNRDLLRDLINPETGTTVFPCKPNRQTFNLIVNGLARENEIGQAISVINTMSLAGIDPTIATWKTLIHGLQLHPNQNNDELVSHETEIRGIVIPITIKRTLYKMRGRSRLVILKSVDKSGRTKMKRLHAQDEALRRGGGNVGRARKLIKELSNQKETGRGENSLLML